MGKNIDKNISENLRSKCSQKLLNHAKQFASDALKTASKRAIQKTWETTGDLVGCKIADRITKISKPSPQNNSEKVTNEHDKEIPKERYISGCLPNQGIQGKIREMHFALKISRKYQGNCVFPSLINRFPNMLKN